MLKVKKPEDYGKMVKEQSGLMMDKVLLLLNSNNNKKTNDDIL